MPGRRPAICYAGTSMTSLWGCVPVRRILYPRAQAGLRQMEVLWSQSRLGPARVQSAFALVLVLPPPAAGAFRLAGGDRPGAGCAADRGEALGVQRVDRNVVGADIGEQLLAAPVEQRAELEQAVLRLGGDDRHVATMRGLLGAQTRDPGLRTRERATERLDLAHEAAGRACRARLVEAVDALPLDQCFEIVVAGVQGADPQPVATLGLRPQHISLGKQPPGVEGCDLDVAAALADQMQDGLVLQ